MTEVVELDSYLFWVLNIFGVYSKQEKIEATEG